jgi:hypothetical protein
VFISRCLLVETLGWVELDFKAVPTPKGPGRALQKSPFRSLAIKLAESFSHSALSLKPRF